MWSNYISSWRLTFVNQDSSISWTSARIYHKIVSGRLFMPHDCFIIIIQPIYCFTFRLNVIEYFFGSHYQKASDFLINFSFRGMLGSIDPDRYGVASTSMLACSHFHFPFFFFLSYSLQRHVLVSATIMEHAFKRITNGNVHVIQISSEPIALFLWRKNVVIKKITMEVRFFMIQLFTASHYRVACYGARFMRGKRITKLFRISIDAYSLSLSLFPTPIWTPIWWILLLIPFAMTTFRNWL